jgi:hypothetical protein
MSTESKTRLVSMTNEEFVKYCLNFSQYGALCQLVVIEALCAGTEKILSTKQDALDEYQQSKDAGQIPFVHMPSFIGAAEELHERLALKYSDYEIPNSPIE